MNNRFYYFAAWGAILLAAIMLQVYFFKAGIYAISPDESARTLTAYNLTIKKALTPWIWPPFYKVFNGIFLLILNDLFLVPRFLVSIVGIFVILALVMITDQLFKNNIVNLITGIFAVVVPQRLIFSIVPLSEIYFILFSLLGSFFLLKWFKYSEEKNIIFSSLCFCISSTIRYEGLFFCLMMIAIVSYRALILKRHSMQFFMGNILLLTWFPVFWVSASWITSSVDNLSITSNIFLERNGPDIWKAIRNVHLYQFARSTLKSPYLLALPCLIIFASKNLVIRKLTLSLFLPLFAISIFCIAKFEISVNNTWRLPSFWLLLLLPFLAFSIYRLTLYISKYPRVKYLSLICITAAISISFLETSAELMHKKSKAFTKNDLLVGEFIKDIDIAFDERILLESENHRFLNVLISSNAPEKFILNTCVQSNGTWYDSILVTRYRGARDYFERNNPIIVDKYLTDNFDLGSNGIKNEISTKIAYIVVGQGQYKENLDDATNIDKIRHYGRWAVYKNEMF